MMSMGTANNRDSTLCTAEVTNGQPEQTATRSDGNCSCLRKLLNCVCCKYQNMDLKENQSLVTVETVTGLYPLTNPGVVLSDDANSGHPRAAFPPWAAYAESPDVKCTRPEDASPDQIEATPEVNRTTGANHPLQAVQSTLAREDPDHPKEVEERHKEPSRSQNGPPETHSTFENDNRIEELSGLEIKEYFSKYFGNEKNAAKAFRHVEQNDILYSLCANPSYRAIVCASLAPFFTHQRGRVRKLPVTITHLLSNYLCNALETHSAQIKDPRQLLLKTGELAYEGICNETSVFDDCVCRQKFQQSEFRSSFLAEILEQDHSAARVTHKFLHPPVQDFLAAVGQFLTADPEDLLRVLEKHYRKTEGQPVAFVRFLFGLCSPISSHLLEEFSGPFPGETTRRLIGFLESRVKLDLQNMNSAQSKIDLLNTLYHLYEYQNEEPARTAVGSVKQLAFGGWSPLKLTPMDCTAVAGGLELCDTVEELNLNRCYIEDRGLRRLIPVLHKCRVLRLNENKLSDSASEGLFAALSGPSCRIQTLELWDNHLTDVCAEHLASALIINRTLEVLVLSHNSLGDSGAKRLCAALRDPDCKITILRLDDNGLTDACAEDLASSVRTNWSLMGLDLDRNYFRDKSIVTFARLIKTCTGLKWIRLVCNNFTLFGKKQLRSLQLSRAGLEVWV